MKRRAGSSPTGMWATLLVLHQEFELFGRDPVSVLRVVLDDGLAARPRMLGSRVRLPGRSRRSAAPAARPIPLPRLPRAMGSWPPRALPPGRLRVRPRRRRPAPGATRVVVLLAAPNRRRTFGPVGAERTLRRDPGLGVGIRPRGSVSGALDGLHRKAGIIPRRTGLRTGKLSRGRSGACRRLALARGPGFPSSRAPCPSWTSLRARRSPRGPVRAIPPRTRSSAGTPRRP